MRSLDWVVVVVYIVWIVYDGLRRSKGTDKVDGYFLANRSLPWWAVGLSVMATQMSAVTIVGTTGQAYADRPPVHPVLLRPAARDDHPVADRGAVLHPRAGLHRVRVSRAPVRRADAIAGELSVPDGPRLLARRDARGALGRHVGDSRMDAAGDRARHLRADDRLHDDRRRAGGGVDRRQADVRRRRRDVGGGRHPALRHPAARQLRPGAAPGGRDRPAEGDRLPSSICARPTRSGRG